MCSATLRLLEPLEEVNSTPSGSIPAYSSVPAHMVWNHLRRTASRIRSGLGQPNMMVARASCSAVTVLLLAQIWTAPGAMASNSSRSPSFRGRRFTIYSDMEMLLSGFGRACSQRRAGSSRPTKGPDMRCRV